MNYEKPQLIRLTGEQWEAGGTCANGQSNPTGDCVGSGLSAHFGRCMPGEGPDPAHLCQVGWSAGGTGEGCQAGAGAAGPPACNPGAGGSCGGGFGAT